MSRAVKFKTVMKDSLSRKRLPMGWLAGSFSSVVWIWWAQLSVWNGISFWWCTWIYLIGSASVWFVVSRNSKVLTMVMKWALVSLWGMPLLLFSLLRTCLSSLIGWLLLVISIFFGHHPNKDKCQGPVVVLTVHHQCHCTCWGHAGSRFVLVKLLHKSPSMSQFPVLLVNFP